jgi:CBS domain-containing protein
MKEILVEQIMVPLEEYASIHQDANLFEAVLALEKAQEEYTRPDTQYPHRAILVYDDDGKIVGKLSQLDIMRALEPKYRKAASGEDGRIMASGFSQEFLRAMVRQFALWDKPLSDICKKATQMKARDCMYIPEEGEYVQADDTMALAMHQLVMGHHQSLLVTRSGNIIGILRLTDVFTQIVETMKECNL